MRRSSLLLAALMLASPAPAPAIDWECSDLGLGEGGCGFATCGDDDRTTADALLVLRSAVGRDSCSPCRCDADGSGTVMVTDALKILRFVVGRPANLLCSSCNDLQIVLGQDKAEYDELVDDVVAAGDDGMRVVSRDGGAIVVRTLDPALEEIGSERRIETGQPSLFGALACAGSGGSVGVAWDWTPQTDFPVPHDYDDIGNVRFAVLAAEATSAEPIDAHVPAIGSQGALGIVCRPGGGFTVVWKASSSAYREVSEGALSHYNVSGGPLNGIYQRNFDEQGAPLAEPAFAIPTYDQPYWPWSRPVLTPAGHVVVGSRDLVFVVNESGTVVESADLENGTYVGSAPVAACSESSDRCATAFQHYGVRARVFDPLAPQSWLYLLLRQEEEEDGEPYSTITEPGFGTLACDEGDVCVATWSLTRRLDVDPEEWSDPEYLGSFGRAFDRRTGDIGDEFPLPSTRIFNTGPGRFVSVERSAYGDPAHSVLHTFEVR